MNILIIEGDEKKYKQIKASLNRILDNPTIRWAQSRNGALNSIIIRNYSHYDKAAPYPLTLDGALADDPSKDEISKYDLTPFDLIICGNMLPLYEVYKEKIFKHGDYIKPYAADIVNQIREYLHLKDLPIIICANEEIEKCDCNYIINYNHIDADTLDAKLYVAIICSTTLSTKGEEEKILKFQNPIKNPWE